jgi:hypothetical protein
VVMVMVMVMVQEGRDIYGAEEEPRVFLLFYVQYSSHSHLMISSSSSSLLSSSRLLDVACVCMSASHSDVHQLERPCASLRERHFTEDNSCFLPSLLLGTYCRLSFMLGVYDSSALDGLCTMW